MVSASWWSLMSAVKQAFEQIPTISGKLDLYTATLQVKFPAVRDSRARHGARRGVARVRRAAGRSPARPVPDPQRPRGVGRGCPQDDNYYRQTVHSCNRAGAIICQVEARASTQTGFWQGLWAATTLYPLKPLPKTCHELAPAGTC